MRVKGEGRDILLLLSSSLDLSPLPLLLSPLLPSVSVSPRPSSVPCRAYTPHYTTLHYSAPHTHLVLVCPPSPPILFSDHPPIRCPCSQSLVSPLPLYHLPSSPIHCPHPSSNPFPLFLVPPLLSFPFHSLSRRQLVP